MFIKFDFYSNNTLKKNMTKTNILLETGTNELEIVEFLISMDDGKKQSFGINVAKVREIIKVPQYDQIPNANKNIVGVFQLRNKVIPLISLNSYLHQNEVEDMKNAKVIVTEFNQQNLGFLIQSIDSIHRVSWEKVLSPAEIIIDVKTNAVVALVALPTKTMMLLDFEKIVSDINPAVSLNLGELQQDTVPKGDNKVLIADDSPLMREMLFDIMSKGGFQIETVNNGKKALEKLLFAKGEVKNLGARLGNYYDLIITDIEMPQMDGHTLCKAIKGDDILKELPVILFSSLIYDELRKKGDTVGADAQISKPDINQLVHVSKDLILKHSKIRAIKK
jgi:two-component system chemotaxis response regulator CheV